MSIERGKIKGGTEFPRASRKGATARVAERVEKRDGLK